MADADKIIEKWQKLQKLIKEEITLSKIICEDDKNKAVKFQEWYYEYYQTKIQIDYELQEHDFILHQNADQILDDAYSPIYELLMRFRQEDDLVIMLIDIIEKNDYIKQSSINNLVRFFCFQFYENLLFSNNNEGELSLIHKMIIREVNTLPELKPSTFIDIRTSFLGKFLHYYALKQDCKHFVSLILGEVLLKINKYNKSFELNLSRIVEKLEKHANSKTICTNGSFSGSSFSEEVSQTILTKSIKKSSFALEENKFQSCLSYKLGDEIFFQNNLQSQNMFFISLPQIEEKNKLSQIDENKDYQVELTEEELLSRMNNTSINAELREIYSKHVGLGNDYTNQKL